MIQPALRTKLILSYLIVALLTILVVSVYIRYTSEQRLARLIEEQQTSSAKGAALTYYTATGSWQGFYDSLSQPAAEPTPQAEPTPGVAGPGGRAGAQGRPGTSGAGQAAAGLETSSDIIGMMDADYRAIIPTLGYAVGEIVPRETILKALPLEVGGKTVGWILPSLRSGHEFTTAEQDFLKRTTEALILAGLVGLAGAVLMGIFLAGVFLRPIRSLMKAAQEMAQGHLQQRVPVTSRDELGQLTLTFNQMSADLERADKERRQMTADITHDLSSPLQVVAGYMEMLQSDAATLTPKRVQIIMTEIDHLRRLVGDLTMLAQADARELAMQLQPVKPSELLERVFHAYQAIARTQGISLDVDVSAHTSSVNVDEGRMMQVFGNLVDNALRYTPEGGRIRLSAEERGQAVRFAVTDSGSGIDPADVPYVFDRFYRADKSRDANSGKMGLGLAISKALVEAQGGSIKAESAGKGEGASIVIEFPATQ
jgi:signal transduction histidine kinase